jgi:hypothetical protein
LVLSGGILKITAQFHKYPLLEQGITTQITHFFQSLKIIKHNSQNSVKTFDFIRVSYKFTNMKTARKIAFYTLCLLLTLSWVAPSVSTIIKTTSERKIAAKKEALPEGKSEVEEKKFELVYDFSAPFSIPFQQIVSTQLHFSKGTALPLSVILDLSNPPPEFHLFA